MRASAMARLACALFIAAPLLGCVGDVSPGQHYRIVDLGALQCTGSSSSNPACQVGQLNDYCEIAGWDVIASGYARAYVWRPAVGGVTRIDLPVPTLRYEHGRTPEQFAPAPLPQSTHLRAYDINNHGEVIGAGTGPRNEAILWRTRPLQSNPALGSRSARTAYLGVIPTGGSVSAGYSINDEAQMAGSAATVDGTHAIFFSTYEGMRDLRDLPNNVVDFAEGLSVGEGASIVGVGKAATGNHAFLWTPVPSNNALIDLGDLPGGANDSRANAVNRTNVVVGQSGVANGSHAFRWEAATGMRDLGDLPGGAEASAAFAIRDTIAPTAQGPAPPADIVGFASNATGRRAAAWPANVGATPAPIDLNTLVAANDPLRANAVLEQAGGINQIGAISVIGRLSGVPHVFLLVPSDADVPASQGGQTPFQTFCLGAFP